MDYWSVVTKIIREEEDNINSMQQNDEIMHVEVKEVNGVQYAELPNGEKIFNSTPHPINFYDPDDSALGEKVYQIPSMQLINARPTEETVREENGITYVKTTFVGSDEGRSLIEKIKSTDSSIIIVGSIIAAQAYPGDVVAMTPAPGFERVPPAQKRMNPKKFTTFE